MNTKIRFGLFIMTIGMLLGVSACGAGAKPAVPAGNYKCGIVVALKGAADMVLLSFTIKPDQKIGSWTIFDLGTRGVTMGDAVGKSSLSGNQVTFALTDPSGTGITYKINGTIESVHKMTGNYTFNYGGSYGVAADKFECDLTPPTPTPTP